MARVATAFATVFHMTACSPNWEMGLPPTE
jgi:hypothetical protein